LTVVYNKSLCFKIEYKNNESPFVDIEYESSKSDSVVSIYNIEANQANEYYLVPIEPVKDLSLIKIRSTNGKEKGEWSTQVLYLDEKDIEQSKLEIFFFGKNTPATVLNEKPDYVNR
jgi:outer membrane lipoprotein-sorting protein